MTFSYFYIKSFKQRHPKKDWSVVERNFIIRTSIKKLGLEKGMMVGGTIVFVLLGIIISLSNTNFIYFLCGMFFMVNIQHWVNLNSMKYLEKIKTPVFKKSDEVKNVKY